MSERRGRVWVFILSAIGVAAGMASCARPALSQHPTHNNPPPPPPPRPPAHASPPRQSLPPRQQVVKPVPPKPTVTQPPVQPPRVEQPGTPGTPALSGTQPPVGIRVPTSVPHPPPRPWEQQNAKIPPSERPPPGMCRVWLDNVPAASQPAATTCAKAIQTRPANGRVIFGENERHPTATRVAPATPSESVPTPPNDSPLADAAPRRVDPR